MPCGIARARGDSAERPGQSGKRTFARQPAFDARQWCRRSARRPARPQLARSIAAEACPMAQALRAQADPRDPPDHPAQAPDRAIALPQVGDRASACKGSVIDRVDNCASPVASASSSGV